MQHLNKLTPQNPSSLRLRQLKIKYEKLKSRIERTMKSGQFYQYSQRKQQSLLERLQRYFQRLSHWGKLAAGTTALGAALTLHEPLSAQSFTQVTDTNSPFIFFDGNLSEPLGLMSNTININPSYADIDGDGDQDAFLGGNDGRIYYFENTTTDISLPAFSASTSSEPFGLSNQGSHSAPVFVDIDKDGDLDAFIGEQNGNINYFENIGNATNPNFTLVSTDNAFGLTDVTFYVFPTFADIDGDGDVDVIIGDLNGNFRFFQNTSANSSVPAFTLTGGVNPFGLSDIGYRSKPFLVDIDGDGDLDLFAGRSDGNTSYFENTGSTSAPAFSLSTSSEPFGIFKVISTAAPTFADIDGDNDLDLTIGENNGSISVLKNVGSSTAPFFQPPVLDLGRYTAPAFADIDGDGDLDLFVGDVEGQVRFYENTTTDSSIPAFSLRSTDAFGIPAFTFRVAPTLADIDGDGDLDLFVGERYGNINFFRNTGNSTEANFVLSSSSEPFGLSDVGNEAVPVFVDIDCDGDLDAFIGSSAGNMNYFQNTGNSTNPVFAPPVTNTPFGITDIGYRSAPSFADMDNDGDLDVFVGTQGSNIFYFENIGDKSAPAFTEVSSDNPFGINVTDNRLKPTIVDLDGDNLWEAVVGGEDGQLFYFESNIILPVELTIFTAKTQNDHVLLHWQTASETDNKGFHIERSSTGKNWENIGFVNGHSTTVEVNDYSFRDKQPLSGINYYRLRQIDFDGSQYYSDIVQVQLKKASLQISPNPVSDVLQVTNGEGRAIVYDLLGRVVKMALIPDTQTVLNVQDLPQGQYVLSITRADGTIEQQRFNK